MLDLYGNNIIPIHRLGNYFSILRGLQTAEMKVLIDAGQTKGIQTFIWEKWSSAPISTQLSKDTKTKLGFHQRRHLVTVAEG